MSRIVKVKGQPALISIYEEDKGRLLEYRGKKYYVVKDNDDFEPAFKKYGVYLITTYVSVIKPIYQMIDYYNIWNENINHWDVSKVENFNHLFFNCSSYDQPTYLNTICATSMRSMFYNCSLLNSEIILYTDNVLYMDYMFLGCWFFNQPLSFNMSNVRSVSHMFANCYRFNQPLYSWNVENIQNMDCMFLNCKLFNQPLNDWKTSNVVSMDSMFSDCRLFNQPLKEWNTSNVLYMSHMFSGCKLFNQNINSWDVSNVISMNGIFYECSSFNQPLNNWNINSNCSILHMLEECISYTYPLPYKILNKYINEYYKHRQELKPSIREKDCPLTIHHIYRMEKNKKQIAETLCNSIKQELLEITLSPERVFDWYFSHEDIIKNNQRLEYIIE